MSFAATLALIASYNRGLPWKASADTSHAARIALWGGGEIAALTFASLIAGLATTSYAAFHFHKRAPYGVLANLFAMPVGILGLLALPFGFDAAFWKMMAAGIDWMIAVVLWVANLPGAAGCIQAFGTGPLLVATAGLLLICLLRTLLRWSGAALAAIACLWVVLTPRPDILVAADGRTAAMRGQNGQLSVLYSGRDTFAIKEWLAADGDTRNVKDAGLHDGAHCDAVGCIGTLKDARLVSMALSAETFAEDCARAVVMVSPRQVSGDCAGLLVDRRVWRANGAIGLRLVGDRFELTATRPPGYERPWSSNVLTTGENTPALRLAARDATPRIEDLQEGDQ